MLYTDKYAQSCVCIHVCILDFFAQTVYTEIYNAIFSTAMTTGYFINFLVKTRPKICFAFSL